jgi:hypothetical protein
MPFLAGRATFVRFKVEGTAPSMFGPEHLERLAEHAIDRQKVADKDGTEWGWIAGDDILDLQFDLAKNVFPDALHCSLRIDTLKLPADLLRSYARAELEVLAATNPSGRPTGKQKKEAKEAAKEKLIAESRDGRFTRRKAFPILWDRASNTVLVGTTSAALLDRFVQVFKDTFALEVKLLDAGHLAEKSSSDLSEVRPSRFLPGNSSSVSWVADPSSVNFLGNEFLLWLWFVLETESDAIQLSDGSEVTVMLAKTLVLDCPRGESGNETIRSDSPVKLPEAHRAIQAGKLPRQAGMILVRHDEQYELNFQPETLALGGAKLPSLPEKDNRLRAEGRIVQLRHLTETMDLLLGAFLQRRLSGAWVAEIERMSHWLQGEPGRLAVAG